MKPYTLALSLLALTGLASLAPAAAQASGYLSSYGGGGSYLSAYGGGGSGQFLSSYGGGGYSSGGGSSVVNFGYSNGGGTDAPHRATWQQYEVIRRFQAARRNAYPPCGQYDHAPAACRQRTLRWNPSLDQ
jgi:hypothetical protein